MSYPMLILNESAVPIRDRMPGQEEVIASVIDKALVRNAKIRFECAEDLFGAVSTLTN